MNVAKVLGIEKVEYTKKDGTQVSGFNINIGEEIDPKYGEGLKVSREYIAKARIIGDLELGCDVDLSFGRGFDGKAYLSEVTVISGN